MVLAPVTVGALAFIGPTHASELTRLCYVRVRRAGEEDCTVALAGPDQDDHDAFEVPTKTLRTRLVAEREALLWPGSYVGKPVAFVIPVGQVAGQWTYGVVSGYRSTADRTTLDIVYGAEVATVNLVAIDEPQHIITVDHLNYALQIGAGTNVAMLNALELLDRQNEICAIAAKRRGKTLSAVEALLTVPFVSDELVPLFRPSTMELVHVRRQYIVESSTQSSKKRAGSIYEDPMVRSRSVATPIPPVTSSTTAAATASAHRSDSSDESDANDVEDIQQQNRTLGKRRRESASSQSSDSDTLPDTTDVGPPTTTDVAFRPSPMTRKSHGSVVKREHRGKEPQTLLELTRLLPEVVIFLATPPVLRGLYDFGFDGLGLELMHCFPLTTSVKRAAKADAIDMTDFSKKNKLKKAPAATKKFDVTEALRGLKLFARYFYNRQTNEIIEAAAAFVERYNGIEDTDATSWASVAMWITEKFGRYRQLLVCGQPDAACAVATQFTRYDESLAEWLEIRQIQRPAQPHGNGHRRSNDEPTRRAGRPQQRSTVPASVRDNLPQQRGKTLCMKFLSVTGCGGGPNGGCFDPKRAHFRPKSSDLRDDARAIINSWGGLAPQYADL